MTALGVLSLFVALFALFAFGPFAILVIWVPVALLTVGIQKISGTRSICCPHCGRPAEIGKNVDKYKCPTCKKRSVRENDYFKPIL